MRCHLQAADDDVQCALMTALMKNPDAQAALQRGLAMQGLSIDMQRLQARASLLPAAAAAILPAGSAASMIFISLPFQCTLTRACEQCPTEPHSL